MNITGNLDDKSEFQDVKSIQIALRERVKELTCLYGIAKIADNPEATLDEILQEIVELLPPAWQYPEIASAKITIGNKSYTSSEFKKSTTKQSADIIVREKKIGNVEVFYDIDKISLKGNPFLTEEEKLIQEIARQISIIIDKRETEKEKKKLHEQLLHADRLATIGQLSAGIAHELNEPLNSILGFAQLIKKHENLPDLIKDDIDKIIKSSLYAREIIRKLLIFSRQLPTRNEKVNINSIIRDSISLFSMQCKKYNVELVLELDDDLPFLTGDVAQLTQVIVNLCVNAIQSMEEKGGKLIIRTYSKDNNIFIEVEDTGIGMSDKIKERIFLPFFTTKNAEKGTGLGLSVVHGIISSIGGKITVKSKPGKGSNFTIRIPLH